MLLIILLVVFMPYSAVYAADALYRFMHNDHDALIIGEIVSVDNNNLKVHVEKNIISGKELNQSSPKKQIKLAEAKIVSPFNYGFFYNENSSSIVNPSVGDYVLLSLEKSATGFKIAWGAYKVDSLDYKNLSVVLPENPAIWSQMDAAAIKAFVNSDGKITKFSFDGDTKTVRAGEEGTVIFEGNDEPTNISEDTNKKEIDSSIGIIGGADGPTSIYLAGNPLKALIIPITVYTLIIFGIGFAIGYFVKTKRLK